MKYFIDAEFQERGYGKGITLISVGVIAEDGRALYRENADIDFTSLTPWVQANVCPHLKIGQPGWEHRALRDPEIAELSEIASDIKGFIADDPAPEFWGYYCAYDYVILSQLMGGMAGWPQGWPYMMHDLRQWLDYEALHHVSQPDDAPHNALEDARWIRETYQAYRSES